MQSRIVGNNTRECAQWFVSDNGTWDWLWQRRRRSAKDRKDRDEREAKELAESVANTVKSPGEYKLRYSTWVGDKKFDVPYQVMLPKGYDTSDKNWPTIVFLAGGGEVAPDLSRVNAIGPVAYMHRPSAMDNPAAPLSHHTFDSTHIAYGVVTAAVDHGPGDD